MIKMSDIAQRVGVSRPTVSAVLNGNHRKLGIKPETAEKIKAAAAKLGYYRNEIAVAIKTGQNAVIGCITIGLNREWVARVVTGLIQNAQDKGFLIKIVNLNDSSESFDSLQRFVQQRMAGIFCCDIHPPAPMAAQFRSLCARYNMPIVAVNSSDRVGGYHLRSDDLQGAELAIRHLWKLGHRRIAHIMGDPHSMTGPLRREGFLRAMKLCGGTVPPHYLVTGTYDAQHAVIAAQKLLSRKKNLPTAIFCANDEVAAAAIRAARKIGLRVPEDLSILGYSNITLSALTDPPLTTVAQPFELMGERAAKVLLDLIHRQPKPRYTVDRLPTKLVIRESTLPPSRG